MCFSVKVKGTIALLGSGEKTDTLKVNDVLFFYAPDGIGKENYKATYLIKKIDNDHIYMKCIATKLEHIKINKRSKLLLGSLTWPLYFKGN